MDKIDIPDSKSRRVVYESLIPQIHSLVDGERDLYANLANVAAALKEAFGFFWVGFYIVKTDDSKDGASLVLGPFQGPVACTRIALGKGVCGTAWKEKRTLIVPDVDEFPGHIACSSFSKSEIVIPMYSENRVVAVLDVDSEQVNDFDDTDALYLERLFPRNFWEICD